MDYDTEYAKEESDYDEMMNMIPFEDQHPEDELPEDQEYLRDWEVKCIEGTCARNALNHRDDCQHFNDNSHGN